MNQFQPKTQHRPGQKGKKENKNSQQNKPNFHIPNNGPNNPNDPRKNINSLYDGNADITVNGKKDIRRCDNWKEMDFNQQLLDNIKECNYIRPRKVQEVVLLYLSEGYNIECQSETGTGKTAAYLIPLVDNLIKEKRNHGLNSNGPYCLIIVPTHEFVQQIFQEALQLTKNTKITVASAYGGMDTDEMNEQLSNGCNILCACLGRLLDLMSGEKQKPLDMSNLKHIVVDEADHFLKGFQKRDISRFFKHEFVPEKDRQICFFSSTLQVKRFNKFSNEFVKSQTKMVRITSVLDSNQLIRYVFDSIPSEPEKFLCLTKRVSDISALNGGNCPKIMIFVNSIKFANELTKNLTIAGFPAVATHSNFSQERREEAYYSFKNGKKKSKILVSVNACGRGVHIPDVDYVINYNLPLDEFTFIQRCGRTGRTKNGTAISFYVESDNKAQAKWINEILQKAGQDIPEFLRGNTLGITGKMEELSLNN